MQFAALCLCVSVVAFELRAEPWPELTSPGAPGLVVTAEPTPVICYYLGPWECWSADGNCPWDAPPWCTWWRDGPFTGPGVRMDTVFAQNEADRDGDGDVDLGDLQEMQRCMERCFDPGSRFRLLNANMRGPAVPLAARSSVAYWPYLDADNNGYIDLFDAWALQVLCDKSLPNTIRVRFER